MTSGLGQRVLTQSALASVGGTSHTILTVPNVGTTVLVDVTAGCSAGTLAQILAVRMAGEGLDFIYDPGTHDDTNGAQSWHWVGEQELTQGDALQAHNALPLSSANITVRVTIKTYLDTLGE